MSLNQLLRVPCGITTQSIALRGAIASLPPEQAEIVYRCLVVGESVRDVAQCKGVTPEQIETMRDDALETLRTLLGGE